MQESGNRVCTHYCSCHLFIVCYYFASLIECHVQCVYCVIVLVAGFFLSICLFSGVFNPLIVCSIKLTDAECCCKVALWWMLYTCWTCKYSVSFMLHVFGYLLLIISDNMFSWASGPWKHVAANHQSRGTPARC